MSGTPSTRFERRPLDRFAAHLSGQLCRVVERTVHHAQSADAAIAQILDHLLGYRASAQDQRRMPFQIAEDSLRQLHARERDGHRPRAHFRLRPHALADLDRALKHAIQHRPRGAVIESLGISGAQLPENFSFAQHHRVEPRRDAEKMPHRVRPVPAVEPPSKIRARHAVKRSKENFHRLRNSGAPSRRERHRARCDCRWRAPPLLRESRACAILPPRQRPARD